MWRLGRLRLILAVLGISALGIITTGLVGYLVLSERGVTFGLDALEELHHTDAPAIGANTFLHREADPRKVKRELEILHESGIGLIRQEFQWIEIEPYAKGERIDTHGVDAWKKYDRIVALAHGLGIEVMARLDRPPAWATPGFNPHTNPSIQMPPADFNDFADFAAAVAARYRDKVKYFQIWNEPNLFGEWGGQPPDPAAYLEMLRVVGTAIRDANPDAVIVLAGLAPTIETGPENLSDLLFLNRLYQLGAKGAFDVASSMSYGLFTGPGDLRIAAERTNFPRAVLWREVMLAHSDGTTPIWAAEYGWMSLPPSWDGQQGIWGNHSAAEQAAWTVEGIERAREQWPWLPTIIIWASRWPHDTHPDDATPFFGLLEKDLTPRAPLLKLQEAYAASPAAGVGLHQETHPAFNFRGPWPRLPSEWASLLLHRQTGQAGARVELHFDGDSVGLLTRRGPNMGQLRVRIDGHDALADAVPRNASGEAILNLYANEVVRLARVPIASGLPEGPHVLELTVMVESDPQSSGRLVIVDGALVGNSRPLWPYLAIIGAWAFAVAAGIWTLGRRVRFRDGLMTSVTTSLDRRLPTGLLTGEALSGVLAAAFVLLPDGSPTSIWSVIRLVIAATLGALALARPMHVGIIAVAAIPFVGVVARTGIFDRPVGETLIVVLVLAWIARALWTHQWPLIRGLWLWLPILMIAIGTAAATSADYPKFAWRDLRTVIVEPALLFLALISVARDRTDPRRLGTALVAGAVISGIVALALIPSGAIVTDSGPPRVRGLFGSPNNLALIVERALPVAVGLAFAVASRRARAFGWVGVSVLVIVLVLTFSRGAWIGALAGLAIALVPVWRRWPRNVQVAAPLVGVGLVALAVVTAGGERLAQLLRASDAATTARPLLWDSAWRMIRDHPVFGVGPDNFLYQYPAYIRPEAWAEPNISHSHNLVLDTWLTLGALGLVVLAMFAVAYARTWRSALQNAITQDQALVYGLGGTMVATVVHGMVDASFFLPELAATFWVVAAATVIMVRTRGLSEPSGDEQ